MKKHAKKILVLMLAVAMLVPSVAMILTSASTSEPVELAFNNLFVFEKWANNTMSSRILADGVPDTGGTIEKDIENGSFTLTKTDMAALEIYTGFGNDATASNNAYYTMDAEPGTDYTFTYNVSAGNLWVFNVYVFYYDANKLYLDLNAYATPAYGVNNFSFTTPSGAEYIQVRFTIGDSTTNSAGNYSATSVYATVQDIAIYETSLKNDYRDVYLSSNNLFSLEEWAGNTNTLPSSFTNGTVKADTNAGTITMVNNVTGYLWTGFGISTDSSNSHYYTMDVEPSTSYILTYDITNHNLSAPIYMQPHIVELDANGYFVTYYNNETASYTGNAYSFTTGSTTESIQLVFALITDNDNYLDETDYTSRYCTIGNIGIYSSSVYDTFSALTFEEITGYPHRKVYAYAGDDSTYGELPVPPNIPDNMVFAGWYTGKDGAGTLITADTVISAESYTVYPKFEPEIDSLTIKSLPVKTSYTLGERLNTTGLVLLASTTYTYEEWTDTDGNGEVDTVVTKEGVSEVDISTGYRYTPEYLTSTGTQTITVSYGGKSVSFNVNVSEYNESTVPVNGTAHQVKIANNVYTFDLTADAFNRYEITYYSNAYVKGVITMGDTTEEFFLEPSAAGSFASYIDNFLDGATQTNIAKIAFTCLDKEDGIVELQSVTTINSTIPDEIQYYSTDEYKVGVDLRFGGVISYIESLDADTVTAAAHSTGTDINYASHVNDDGATATSTSVNLINTYDRGRYLQQSYYGTYDKPFEKGNYNGLEWNYNPVQGGNNELKKEDGNGNYTVPTGKGGENSKVIDFRLTEDGGLYVKTRPLDWAKNSVDYPDSYNTPSYMETWYYIDDKTGSIKADCRFVDYSGYPSATTTQELPAFYPVEPLNVFIYYDENGEKQTDVEPEFWGVSTNYNKTLVNNGYDTVDPTVTCSQSWAAFMTGTGDNDFGIGIYSPGVTDFHYGCFPSIYNEESAETGTLVENGTARHAVTADPSTENPTSYIAPVGVWTMESYKAFEYTYYLATGNATELENTFEIIADEANEAELAKAKVAVPETVYMTPADGDSTVGQYYVNNILGDFVNYYNVETVAEANDLMYFGFHIGSGKSFTVNVTNVTNPSEEIVLGNADGTGSYEGTSFTFDETGTYESDEQWGLYFASGGLAPGEKATAKWEITVTLDDGSTETYTAYTVLYAPERTVGAVAEARQVEASVNEISSWITGANGVDHTQRAPLGSLKSDMRNSGYFRVDPLVYPDTIPTGGSSDTSYDYILGYGTPNGSDDDYEDDCYVMQTATNGHDSSRSQSYLGLLAIDKSRYTNTDQIPNLKMGWDVLRVGSYESNSLGKYTTYYTLGTESSYTATSVSEAPSGWTTYSGTYTDIAAGNSSFTLRETHIPSYTVSDDLNGKYLHALNQGKADQTINTNQYSTAGTSVLISITDKSELRDSVLSGYTLPEEDYTSSTYDNFIEKLEDAATVLGDPSTDQTTIDEAQKELDEAMDALVNTFYSLKYDNLFSAYEMSLYSASMTMNNTGSITYSDGTLITVNDALASGSETYSSYGGGSDFYHIALEPNTEYVFEYDVTTSEEAQAFMFFYNSSGGFSVDGNGSFTDYPRNMSIKVNDGAWGSKSESSSWWGNYTNSAGTYSYAIKFTTGPDVAMAGFRFGNTTPNACASTFSNIRLIESAKYYEDATYEKTEDVYKQYASYGTLQTPVRTGYTFLGWVDVNGASVTGADIATANKTIYSTWREHSYTIAYNANGGSGSVTNQVVKFSKTVALDSGSGLTYGGYNIIGWSTDSSASTADYALGQSVSKLSSTDGDIINLYAVWQGANVNVTFDNLIDFSAWNKASSKGVVSDITETGFTLTSNSGVGEATCSSPYFEVTPGKQYKIDIDIEGDNWDVYIFFCDADGNWIEFADGEGTRFSSYTDWSNIKTAPDNESVVKAQIRVDANGSGNTVKFDNLRVYEYNGYDIDVTPVNKTVYGGQTFGELPVPTREGFTFNGWYEGDTLITADTTVTQSSTVYLTSSWTINSDALVSDTVIVDFAKPIAINPLANDTAFNSASGTKSFNGISSAENGSFSTSAISGNYGTFTVSGETVTYTPSAVINGTEVIYYQTSFTVDGVTTNITDSITVAPASNVLYEENMLTVSNASGLAWNTVGTAATGNQDASASTDVYGYDSSYNKLENYSNGSALQVSVNATDKRSQMLSFTFEGTGFDLNSACGPDTGVVIVSVKDNTAGKMVKSYIVDTYYADNDDEGLARYGETLYQTPVINETELSYSNYTVQICASWLPSMSGALNAASVSTQTLANGMTANIADYANSDELRAALADIGMEYILDAEETEVVWFDNDSVLNGGKGVNTVAEGELEAHAVTSLRNIVDSVRVYFPITDGDLYYIESEQGVKYYNVIDNLVNTDNGSFTIESLFAYIMGNDSTSLTVENYESIGPKDELYLTSGSGVVTFTINNLDKSASRVMVSLRSASGKNVVVNFGNNNTLTVASGTEMYYDITDYVESDGTVVIQNSTASALLSVGSVKISGVVSTVLLNTFNLDTAYAMLYMPTTVPETTVPETTVPDTTVPETTVPETTVPETTVPETTVPETTVPETTVPGTTVPETTVPGTTVPETTVPDVTEPDESEPSTEDNTAPEDTTGTTEAEDEDDDECWFIKFLKWLIGMLKKLVVIMVSFFAC